MSTVDIAFSRKLNKNEAKTVNIKMQKPVRVPRTRKSFELKYMERSEVKRCSQIDELFHILVVFELTIRQRWEIAKRNIFQ